MDSACPKELATEILSDSDHSTMVAPTTLTHQILGLHRFMIRTLLIPNQGTIISPSLSEYHNQNLTRHSYQVLLKFTGLMVLSKL